METEKDEGKPSFPVTYCSMILEGIFSSNRKLVRETFDDLEMLANDVEMIDTRDENGNFWLEDADGKLWDFKLDILKGRISETEFFPRP